MAHRYQCHYCGLYFSIGSDVGPRPRAWGLICKECGTQHRLRGAEWIIFRNGPEFRKLTEKDTTRYLREHVDYSELHQHLWQLKWEAGAPQRTAKAEREAAELEERRVAYRKALETGEIQSVPPRINLKPSRRRFFHLDESSLKKIVNAVVLVVGFPYFFGYVIWLLGRRAFQEVKERLPSYKRREAERKAAYQKWWEERWRIVPLSALTEREKYWENGEGYEPWLEGVTCGHCGAVGSLINELKPFGWPECPLCKNAPLEYRNIYFRGEVGLSQ